MAACQYCWHNHADEKEQESPKEYEEEEKPADDKAAVKGDMDGDAAKKEETMGEIELMRTTRLGMTGRLFGRRRK